MTVEAFINKCQVRYPDLTDTNGLVYLNEANRLVCERVPVALDDESLSSLAVGTRTYALPANVVCVYSARYQRTSTVDDFKTLSATSVDKLESLSSEYLAEDDDEPDQFYVTRDADGVLKLGLRPAPDTASSGGYPRIVLRVGRAKVLVSGDTMPYGEGPHEAWMHYVFYRHALDANKDGANSHYQDFELAIRRLAPLVIAANRAYVPQQLPLSVVRRHRRTV